MKTIYRRLEIREVDNGYVVHFNAYPSGPAPVETATPAPKELVILTLPQLLKTIRTFLLPEIAEKETT